MSHHTTRGDNVAALRTLDDRHNALTIARSNSHRYGIDPAVLDWALAHSGHFADKARRLEAEVDRLRARVDLLEGATSE